MSSKILRFLTHLLRKTKLGKAISSTTPSLHTKYIFSLIHDVEPNGYNLDPLILFWECHDPSLGIATKAKA
jgi:hypothetical protein